MNWPRPRGLTIAYLWFIAASLVVGWAMPAFYDWTGANQSRPAPVVAKVAWGLAAAAAVVWLALPWLPIDSQGNNDGRARSLQFGLRTLLLITSATAVAMVLLLRFPAAVGGTVSAASFCCAIWFVITGDRRLPTTALLACTLLPYVWMFTNDTLTGNVPVIFKLLLTAPALLPAAIVGMVAGQSLHDLVWLAMLLTGGELLLGIWLIRRGPKRGVAYLLLVWLLSTYGSFGLHALTRM